MQFYNVHGELLIRMEDNVLYLKTMLGYFPIVVFFVFLSVLIQWALYWNDLLKQGMFNIHTSPSFLCTPKKLNTERDVHHEYTKRKSEKI